MLNPAASLDGIYFPFGDSKTHFEKSIAKIAPKIHPRVADARRGPPVRRSPSRPVHAPTRLFSQTSFHITGARAAKIFRDTILTGLFL
jgi:hypothetical protein